MSTTATESLRSTPIPGNATIKKIYAWCSADPGGSASWTIKLRDAAADSGFQVVLNAGETYDTTTADYDLHAGDLVDLSITPANTPATAVIWTCIIYEPATSNHYYLMASALDLTADNNFAPVSDPVLPTGGRCIMPHSGSISAIYGKLTAAPGVGASRTITMAVDGVAKDFVLSFGESDTSLSDTSGTAAWVSAGSYIRGSAASTGSPAAAILCMGTDVACDTPNSFALFSAVQALNTDADGYVHPATQTADHDTTSTNRDMYTPDLTISNLYVFFYNGSPGTGESFTVTLVDDTVQTGLSAVVNDAELSDSDTETVVLAVGSRFTIYVDLSAGANTTRRYYGGMLATLLSLPTKAATPDPITTGTGVTIHVDPTWTDGGGATSYDVYFGTDSTPDETEFIGNQAGTTYDRSVALSVNTTYYWRIDSKNAAGTTTGDVWSFTTAEKENDFSTDGECVALWLFNTVGNLGDDSKGTNNLTNVTSHLAVADTSVKKEGTTSADWESLTPCYMTIDDGSLDSGFPFKNGDTNKKISVALWCRPESLPTGGGRMYLFSKYNTAKISYALALKESGGSVYVNQITGYNAGGSEEIKTNTGRAIHADNTWYHILATYNDTDKSYALRVYDGNDTASITGYTTNNINVEDAAVYLGASATLDSGYFDGRLDEVVIFRDIISSTEDEAIIGSTYTGPSGGGGGGSIFRSVVQ